MDSHALITLTWGATTLILAAATTHCFTRAMQEANHGSFRRGLMWVGASGPLALPAMLAGTLTLVKGAGLG